MTRKEQVEIARMAFLAWRDKGCPVAAQELKVIPPCEQCGKVPIRGYARSLNGAVQCADRRECYANKPD